MECFRDVIEAFGARKAFAEAVGISPIRASAWWQRKSIPGDMWVAVVNAANDGGVTVEGREITVEALAALAYRKSEVAA